MSNKWIHIKDTKYLPDEEDLCLLGNENNTKLSAGYYRNGKWTVDGDFTHFQIIYDTPITIDRQIKQQRNASLVFLFAMLICFIFDWQTAMFVSGFLLISPMLLWIDLIIDRKRLRENGAIQ